MSYLTNAAGKSPVAGHAALVQLISIVAVFAALVTLILLISSLAVLERARVLRKLEQGAGLIGVNRNADLAAVIKEIFANEGSDQYRYVPLGLTLLASKSGVSIWGGLRPAVQVSVSWRDVVEISVGQSAGRQYTWPALVLTVSTELGIRKLPVVLLWPGLGGVFATPASKLRSEVARLESLRESAR